MKSTIEDNQSSEKRGKRKTINHTKPNEKIHSQRSRTDLFFAKLLKVIPQKKII